MSSSRSIPWYPQYLCLIDLSRDFWCDHSRRMDFSIYLFSWVRDPACRRWCLPLLIQKSGFQKRCSDESTLSDPAFWSRFQFAFTLIYHYLFPQLTMGLGWFLVYWKWRALKTGDEKYNRAVRFWAKIFGLNFAVGVVTGIPMEFQFGTNWASFSRYAGGTIGQTLAMEGMFAFFLESAFVGALIWGEKRLGPRYHFLAAVAVALGSWLSGYFILVTNAFMQHPVGYQVDVARITGHREF